MYCCLGHPPAVTQLPESLAPAPTCTRRRLGAGPGDPKKFPARFRNLNGNLTSVIKFTNMVTKFDTSWSNICQGLSKSCFHWSYFLSKNLISSSDRRAAKRACNAAASRSPPRGGGVRRAGCAGDLALEECGPSASPRDRWTRCSLPPVKILPVFG